MNTSEGKIDGAVQQLLYKLETHIKIDVQLNTWAKEARRGLSIRQQSCCINPGPEFILEIACRAAEKVILDRRIFNLNDQQYVEFINMLDASMTAEPCLEKLLARRPQWKK